jgi:hypothetical protein
LLVYLPSSCLVRAACLDFAFCCMLTSISGSACCESLHTLALAVFFKVIRNQHITIHTGLLAGIQAGVALKHAEAEPSATSANNGGGVDSGERVQGDDLMAQLRARPKLKHTEPTLKPSRSSGGGGDLMAQLRARPKMKHVDQEEVNCWHLFCVSLCLCEETSTDVKIIPQAQKAREAAATADLATGNGGLLSASLRDAMAHMRTAVDPDEDEEEWSEDDDWS